MTSIFLESIGLIKNDQGFKETIWRITLKNDKIKLQILNYGATISSLEVFGSHKFDDIVLGYDNSSCKII